MITFRHIRNDDDWKIVGSWHRAAGIKWFTWKDFPQDTSYFALVNGEPALAISLIVTNSSFAWLEGFVGNPAIGREYRRKATLAFAEFLAREAKMHGKTKLITMAAEPKLTEYFHNLGFRTTGRVDVLIKGIE